MAPQNCPSSTRIPHWCWLLNIYYHIYVKCNIIHRTSMLAGNCYSIYVLAAMACPVNSHYEFNGSACQPTCEDPSAHLTCDYPDTEVCVCNDGMILRDGTCVYRSQCGCKDDNNVRRKVNMNTITTRWAREGRGEGGKEGQRHILRNTQDM